MLLNTDFGETLLMIALVALYGTTLYATYRSTKALKNEITRKPEMPDIVQMASLEDATGFKVVDKEGYRNLQTLNTATSALPDRVERVEQKITHFGQELHEIRRLNIELTELTTRAFQDEKAHEAVVSQAFSDLNENLRNAMSALFQRLEEDAQ
jgi:hypothetical protein